MAAAGIGNPAGYVPVFDGGNPRIITGRAGVDIVSGGVFVYASGTTGIVSSGINSFVSSDIKFVGDASGLAFNGICVQTTGSNEYMSVATRGVFILQCVGSVFAGQMIQATTVNAIDVLGSKAVPTAATNPGMAGMAIGRALTAGASGGYAIADIWG